MSKPKFTPGLWTTDESPNEQDDYCIWAPDGAFLANIGNGEKSVVGEPRPQGGDCIAFDITTRANAHLIAAAPDLYAALENLLVFADHVNHGRERNCHRCDANAALAKARGES